VIKLQEDIDYIEINPKSPAKYSVIWLHGLGADGSDFVPIVPELRLPSSYPLRFIFPHAPVMPVTINQGYEMRAWFDIYDLSIAAKIDEAGIANSVATVAKFIQAEQDRGIKSENIILAGFSQGAVIALITVLTHQQKLGGAIALSGYLPLAEKMLQNASSANVNTPIFLGHGTQDPIVPYVLGTATYVALKQANYPVDWHSYPMQHAVCEQEIRDISEWTQKTLSM